MAPEVRALLQNWELKLLALVLGLGLWFFVMSSDRADIVLSVRVELHQVPPGLVVVGERPESVDVQLQGIRTSLGHLTADQVRARVSLSGVGAGDVAFRLLPEHITAPRGITVLRISPSRVEVTLEASRSAQVRVEPAFRGVPPGYRVGPVRVTPPEVTIEGPASLVARVSQVATEPVDIAGATGTVERVAAILAPGKAIRVAGARTARVVVQVTEDTDARLGPRR
jgi:YbbR domain-containing protein